MTLYWSEGFNQYFVMLRHRIEMRQIYGASENRRGLEDDEFGLSFPKRSSKMWSSLCAPYRLEDKDTEDFIVEDIDEVVQRPVLFEQAELDLEDQFIQHLRNKRKGFDQDCMSLSEDSSRGEQQDESPLNCLRSDREALYSGPQDNEDSSEDEWVSKKLSAQKKSWKSKQINTSRKFKNSHISENNSDSEDGLFINDKKQVNLSNNRTLQNSDNSDSDVAINASKTKKRKLLHLDDEESDS